MKKVMYLFLALLIIAGCKKENQQESSNAIKVTVEEVKSITTTDGLRYSGTIEPFQSIPLSFQTNGTVLNVLVNAGDAVHKGQLLATIDNTDAKNMYEMTNAKYKQAKDAYNRLKEVHDKGSLPEVKWVEMESNLQQAESSLGIAKSNLNKCNMHAPDNGIIGKRNIEPGMSSLGNPVSPLELIKIEKVYVKIAVPENEISNIKKGYKASFRVSALNNEIFEGTVNNVGVVADQISRTYEVKLLVDNKNLALKPGMVCDVNLNISAERKGLAVSFKAVDTDKDNNHFVYVADPSLRIAKKRIVHIGSYQNNDIEILSGLTIGDKVVCEGKEKISDNSKIDY
jgi:RND family efflux transporter MFP subunit